MKTEVIEILHKHYNLCIKAATHKQFVISLQIVSASSSLKELLSTYTVDNNEMQIQMKFKSDEAKSEAEAIIDRWYHLKAVGRLRSDCLTLLEDLKIDYNFQQLNHWLLQLSS